MSYERKKNKRKNWKHKQVQTNKLKETANGKKKKINVFQIMYSFIYKKETKSNRAIYKNWACRLKT